MATEIKTTVFYFKGPFFAVLLHLYMQPSVISNLPAAPVKYQAAASTETQDQGVSVTIRINSHITLSSPQG